MGTVEDILAIAAHCKHKLDFGDILAQSQSYQHLPACVIDTVFSIGARYTSTSKTVARFCTKLGFPIFGTDPYPPINKQFSITDFLSLYENHSAAELAQTFYENKQRTSTRNGILKAEAAKQFGQVLQANHVEYLQDVENIVGHAGFEQAIQQIPGQRSGISLRYFYILTGSSEHIKPDRMVLRFLLAATSRIMSVKEAEDSIRQTCAVLQREYPQLTPALLDNMIWRYQQSQGLPPKT